MARITSEELAKFHLTPQEHPCWSGTFSEPTRCAQVEEDLFAARSVAAVLMAIVTFGAVLGAMGVVLATLF